jgi:hypothetical protein
MTHSAILTELEAIGLDVEIFQYGDSLSALLICNRIEERFEREMTLLVLAENPTLKAVAAWLSAHDEPCSRGSSR